MSKTNGKTVARVPTDTIRAGTELPPEIAAMVTLAVFLRRAGDDATGQYEQMEASVMLQAGGDDHLMARLEAGQGKLSAAIRSFEKALTEVLGGEIIRRSSGPTAGSRRVGRA